jgi:acyl-CoA thioester hydrolase
MAKPDPQLLDPACYPHHAAVTTRYADMDPNNHINNVAMAAIIEDGRVRFHIESGNAKALPAGGQIMIVSLTIDYLAQAHYPLPISVHTGIAAIGSRSLRLRHLLVQEGRAVALAEGTAVFVLDGKAAVLPEELMPRLQKWLCS